MTTTTTTTEFRRRAAAGGKSILQSNPRYQTNPAAAAAVQVAVVSPDRAPNRGATGATRTARTARPTTIPSLYVQTIVEGFGPDADLYTDVLLVPPHANPRQVRIAYFRRGREILAEGGVQGLDPTHLTQGLVRLRFQAVSMAYEIISTPEWKQAYLEQGGLWSMNNHTLDRIATGDARSVTSTGGVAKATTTTGGGRGGGGGGSSRRRRGHSRNPSSSSATSVTSTNSRGVRWNEHVEELLFDKDPEEKEVPRVIKKKRSKRKQQQQQQQQQQIFVEADAALDDQLRELDDQAEQHFVTDFLDSLEESLDDLLKLADYSNGSGGKHDNRNIKRKEFVAKANMNNQNNNNNNNEDAASVSSVATDDTPFDEPSPEAEGLPPPKNDEEDSIVDMLTNKLWGRYKSPKTGTNSPQTSVRPLTRSRSKSPIPFRSISPDPIRQQEEEEYMEGAGEDELFDVESIAFSDASSLKGGNSKNSKAGGGSTNANGEDEDVFEGLLDDNKEALPAPVTISLQQQQHHHQQGRGSPTSLSVVSDLSGSVAANVASTAAGAGMSSRAYMPTSQGIMHRVPEEAEDEIPSDTQRSGEPLLAGAAAVTNIDTTSALQANFHDDDDDFEDTWCEEPSKIMQSFIFGMGAEDRKSKELTAGTTTATTTAIDAPRSSKDDGFLEYFIAYIQAIVQECESMGQQLSSVDWQDAVLGAFMVDDDDVDEVMTIVEQELQKAPSLHAEDVMKAPMSITIETARSF